MLELNLVKCIKVNLVRGEKQMGLKRRVSGRRDNIFKDKYV